MPLIAGANTRGFLNSGDQVLVQTLDQIGVWYPNPTIVTEPGFQIVGAEAISAIAIGPESDLSQVGVRYRTFEIVGNNVGEYEPVPGILYLTCSVEQPMDFALRGPLNLVWYLGGSTEVASAGIQYAPRSISVPEDAVVLNVEGGLDPNVAFFSNPLLQLLLSSDARHLGQLGGRRPMKRFTTIVPVAPTGGGGGDTWYAVFPCFGRRHLRMLVTANASETAGYNIRAGYVTIDTDPTSFDNIARFVSGTLNIPGANGRVRFTDSPQGRESYVIVAAQKLAGSPFRPIINIELSD